MSWECLFPPKKFSYSIQIHFHFILCIQLGSSFGLFSQHGLHLNRLSWTTTFCLALQNHFSSYCDHSKFKLLIWKGNQCSERIMPFPSNGLKFLPTVGGWSHFWKEIMFSLQLYKLQHQAHYTSGSKLEAECIFSEEFKLYEHNLQFTTWLYLMYTYLPAETNQM